MGLRPLTVPLAPWTSTFTSHGIWGSFMLSESGSNLLAHLFYMLHPFSHYLTFCVFLVKKVASLESFFAGESLRLYNCAVQLFEIEVPRKVEVSSLLALLTFL